MNRRLIAFAMALLAGFVIAAGDDDPTGTPTPEPPPSASSPAGRHMCIRNGSSSSPGASVQIACSVTSVVSGKCMSGTCQSCQKDGTWSPPYPC